VDISINQAPIIIEADGIQHTWHDGPQRDAQRDVDHEAAGFKTFRFTGSEINTDAVACIQRVVDACGLTPDADPVYDIRTGFTGTDHPNWVDDRQDFTCDKCGDVFHARAFFKNGKKKYCTMKCYNAAKTGQKLSESHKKAIGDGVRGKPRKPVTPFSDERRANLSAALKGKKKSPEHAAKVGAANRGKIRSPETRAQISASVKRYYQTKIKSDLTGDGESSAEMTEPTELISK
jgi:hypothetical protein